MNFVGCELEVEQPHAREEVVEQLRRSSRLLLVLDTCQRLETFGFDVPRVASAKLSRLWSDREAFERLARITAGLESRILGELEIIGQVRAAYQFFRAEGVPDPMLDRIFQDAIALAREARRVSGIDRHVTSLSGIAGRLLLERVPAGAHLAVVGAGSLAGAVARYLSKRGNSPIRIASRCPENAVRLAVELGGFGTGLDELAHLFHGVQGIVSATAAPHPLIYPHHLGEALRPLVIIDLGEPPDCHPAVATLPGIEYIGLKAVETIAQDNLDERRRCAEIAARIIRDGASAWKLRR